MSDPFETLCYNIGMANPAMACALLGRAGSCHSSCGFYKGRSGKSSRDSAVCRKPTLRLARSLDQHLAGGNILKQIQRKKDRFLVERIDFSTRQGHVMGYLEVRLSRLGGPEHHVTITTRQIQRG